MGTPPLVLLVQTPRRDCFNFSWIIECRQVLRDAQSEKLEPKVLDLARWGLLSDRSTWNSEQMHRANYIVERIYEGYYRSVWFIGDGCCEFTRELIRVTYNAKASTRSYTPAGSIVNRLINWEESYWELELFGERRPNKLRALSKPDYY